MNSSKFFTQTDLRATSKNATTVAASTTARSIATAVSTIPNSKKVKNTKALEFNNGNAKEV